MEKTRRRAAQTKQADASLTGERTTRGDCGISQTSAVVCGGRRREPVWPGRHGLPVNEMNGRTACPGDARLREWLKLCRANTSNSRGTAMPLPCSCYAIGGNPFSRPDRPLCNVVRNLADGRFRRHRSARSLAGFSLQARRCVCARPLRHSPPRFRGAPL
jgi:hypothetical protein